MPSSKIHRFTSCEYFARTLSDHAALLVTVPASTPITRCNRWRFTSRLFNDSGFVNMINREIDSFLHINQNTVNPNIVWDAMKAYLRGQIIAYTSSKRKKFLTKIQCLENNIRKLERQHIQSYDNIILQQLKSKQLEYNMLT